jgi:hypothetical protein
MRLVYPLKPIQDLRWGFAWVQVAGREYCVHTDTGKWWHYFGSSVGDERLLDHGNWGRA